MSQHDILHNSNSTTLVHVTSPPDDVESRLQRLQCSITTIADMTQMLIRQLNENMVEQPEIQKTDKKVLRRIRKLKWAMACGDTCVICHDAPMRGKAKKLPCGHLFHPQCIIPWLKITPSCPKCRKPLE